MNEKTKQIASIIIRRRRVAAAAAVILLLESRRVHRWWVHPINQKRLRQCDWNNLMLEMRLFDEVTFFNYTRLTINQFDLLLSLIENHLTKIDTFRKPIPPGARLAVTLRFLVTGDSLASIAYTFRIGKSTACNIIKETCNVLWEVLSRLYLKFPTEAEWKNIAQEYENKWNLPNCVGSIDGKHVLIQPPKHSGSKYFNSKKSFSVILFAICDANYNFTYIDIGAYGSQSHGGVLRESSFGRKFFAGALNLPDDANITDTNAQMSFYFVGDEAFPLNKHLLHPYGETNLPRDKRIFNYRLSKARRCIENAFGILVARFKVFHKTINANPETVDSIIKAAVCLHNFIKCTTVTDNYCPVTYTDRYDEEGNLIFGEWRNEVPKNPALSNVRQLRMLLGTRNATRTAEQYRSILNNYVNSPYGALPCQDTVI